MVLFLIAFGASRAPEVSCFTTFGASGAPKVLFLIAFGTSRAPKVLCFTTFGVTCPLSFGRHHGAKPTLSLPFWWYHGAKPTFSLSFGDIMAPNLHFPCLFITFGASSQAIAPRIHSFSYVFLQISLIGIHLVAAPGVPLTLKIYNITLVL